jgi:hypothetical protein
MKSAIEKFASVDQTKPKHLVARGMRKQQQINGRWPLKTCTYLGLKATMSFVWLHKHWPSRRLLFGCTNIGRPDDVCLAAQTLAGGTNSGIVLKTENSAIV